MNKQTTFPELLEYFPTYYDESAGEYYSHRFISESDTLKCVMSDEQRKLVETNVCLCGGRLMDHNYSEDIGEIDFKYCKICGGIYVMKIVEK